MSEVLRGAKVIQDVARLVPGYDSFYYVAADTSLDMVELELGHAVAQVIRLQRAQRDLSARETNWDYILIDTPCSFGVLSFNALLASDNVFTVLHEAENRSAYLFVLEDFLGFAEQHFEKKISYLGAVITEPEMPVDTSVNPQLTSFEKWQVLRNKIAWSREAQEADRYRQLVVDGYPVSSANLDYLKCAREFNKIFI